MVAYRDGIRLTKSLTKAFNRKHATVKERHSIEELFLVIDAEESCLILERQVENVRLAFVPAVQQQLVVYVCSGRVNEDKVVLVIAAQDVSVAVVYPEQIPKLQLIHGRARSRVEIHSTFNNPPILTAEAADSWVSLRWSHSEQASSLRQESITTIMIKLMACRTKKRRRL